MPGKKKRKLKIFGQPLTYKEQNKGNREPIREILGSFEKCVLNFTYLKNVMYFRRGVFYLDKQELVFLMSRC